jgi:hypothetical protein
MKAFNVRLAIVEPGVIATPIFTKANTLPKDALLKRWTQVPPMCKKHAPKWAS